MKNNDKSWVKHLSVFVKELRIVVCPLLESSEECAIQLHHYTPQDEIDKGMFCLFVNKNSNPKGLFEVSQEIIKNRENNSNVQLVNLWDKCLIHQYERDEFFEFTKVESADEVYELLSQEVSLLQESYVKCAKIYRWMLERRALIEKMIKFEKKESDPRPSFKVHSNYWMKKILLVQFS
ncbi:hypothetical protein Glove_168g38 [Diversispora epigaea]|uniref:Uncharacterized protein n=1 Tax=Diversispora epigaea TaxID=1348612 RepID=A0A397IPS9_9GLOM|nr:hypothetical protein Glove_168g38 [Diversispora epigaea]